MLKNILDIEDTHAPVQHQDLKVQILFTAKCSFCGIRTDGSVDVTDEMPPLSFFSTVPLKEGWKMLNGRIYCETCD